MTAIRDAIFISHATPEDNAFTLWLGARLTALGYQVFADVLRLKGGDDWERKLEDAIRNRAKRFLLVATPGSVQKQGVRNEINLAVETAKRIEEEGFIIPLRLAAYAPPLQIAHTQYLDFEKGWARGLAELLSVLDGAGVTKVASADDARTWQGLQLKDERTVGNNPETLVSNWLSIDALPSSIAFYDFKVAYQSGSPRRQLKIAPFRLPLTIAVL
jgi:TIR domain